MLNELIVSNAPFKARAAVWIAYYPLMAALSKALDRFERTISQRYESVAPFAVGHELDGWSKE